MVAHGQPPAQVGFRLGGLPAHGVSRLLQRFAGADVVPFFADGRCVAGLQGIDSAELEGVHAQLLGHHVHVRFHGKRDLRLGRSAHMSARDVVGVDHVAVDLHVGYPVGSAAVIGPPQVHPGLERAKRAAVEHNPGLPRPEPPVFFHAGAQSDDPWVAGITGHQFLDVVHHHLDRLTRMERQVVAERDIHEGAFAAKVAADSAGVDAYLLLG